jgi:4-hydroxythreonine-4-phosphate dehydrogenase
MGMDGVKPIALTMGEPAGIAPDITLKAWLNLKDQEEASFFLIGDAALLQERARQLAAEVEVASIHRAQEASSKFKFALPVLHRALTQRPKAGQLAGANAAQVIGAIETAVALALAGEVSAIVTNPIHKKTLYSAGFKHTGHTDYIASLVRDRGLNAEPVMMLAAPGLRTVPLTVHIPLREVARALSVEMIVKQTRVVDADLKRYFGILRPRIAVTGLNPHAGEGGALGGEEQTVINPAIDLLRREGLEVEGPLPADSVFHEEARSRFDIVVCMFHDQALIPVKTIGFHEGVNATLGLPIVRTSPDHGTALALAGSGKANPTSLISALKLAASMAEHARRAAR